LIVGVLGWWLAVFGLVAALAPASTDATQNLPSVIVLGVSASIHAPPAVGWLIPIDRQTYDDYWVAFGEDDEGALAEVLSRPGWVTVANCERVRVVITDGESIQIEVLDGVHSGRLGWVKMWQLRPLCRE
jgi:hypothetical protein